VAACAIASVLVLTVGAATATAGPRGVLSKAEYQQLSAAVARIKTLRAQETRNPQNFSRAGTVCHRMRSVSPLVGAVRTGCLDLITLGGDWGKLNAAATKCGIDPGSTAALLTCLIPTIQTYHGDAEAVYRASNRLDGIARRRGFGASCVAVIGASQRDLAAEQHLVAELESALQALESQNSGALQTVMSGNGGGDNVTAPGSRPLSVCPHL